MALSLVTSPATEPVSLAEAKLHLRVDVTDDDALITTLIEASRQIVETYTHRAVITQTWDYMLDAFPTWCEAIEIPKPPIQSITSISYVDTNGTTQTWSSTLYQTDLPAGTWARIGRVLPAYQQIYPVTRQQMNAVTVRFVAGYGVATAVPGAIKAAMKLLIGNLWMNREASQVVRGAIDTLPYGVEALLWPFKAF